MILCYGWSFSALNKRKEMFSTSEILSKLKGIAQRATLVRLTSKAFVVEALFLVVTLVFC